MVNQPLLLTRHKLLNYLALTQNLLTSTSEIILIFNVL